MTEPRRLLESTSGECNAFEADLLRAGRGDAMSGSSKRALVAAALGGTLATVAAAHATVDAVAAAKVGTSVFAKWMLLVLAGVVLAGSGGLLLARTPVDADAPATASAAPPAPLPAATIPAAVTASAMAAATAAATAPDPDPSARRALPSSAAPSLSPSPVPSMIAADDLAAEAALLDQAREDVARRDGAGALAVLAEHARAFPRPGLADEAFVLRAEALSAQGDAVRLRAIAAPWLASHGASPYAPRVRRALAQASPAPSGAPLP